MERWAEKRGTAQTQGKSPLQSSLHQGSAESLRKMTDSRREAPRLVQEGPGQGSLQGGGGGTDGRLWWVVEEERQKKKKLGSKGKRRQEPVGMWVSRSSHIIQFLPEERGWDAEPHLGPTRAHAVHVSLQAPRGGCGRRPEHGSWRQYVHVPQHQNAQSQTLGQLFQIFSPRHCKT